MQQIYHATHLQGEGGHGRGSGRGRGRRGRYRDDEEEAGMTLEEWEAQQQGASCIHRTVSAATVRQPSLPSIGREAWHR
jgi:hypothetical protein